MLAFVSDVLTAPVKISGRARSRNLVASTSGTDADWVVKLIDVYPDEVAGQPEMGGYQLMVSADIFRGRYRESFETPKAIAPDTAARCTASPCRRRTTFPAGPPDHGAGPVELVPALRPQPADLRAEHLLGQAGGLPRRRRSGSTTRPASASFVELPVVTPVRRSFKIRVIRETSMRLQATAACPDAQGRTSSAQPHDNVTPAPPCP